MKKQKPAGNYGGELARELPYKLYNMTEIAIELDVSVKYVRKLRKAGAPFTLEKKTRPEWILDWILAHINDLNIGGPSIS